MLRVLIRIASASAHNMFLTRNNKHYLSIIIKYHQIHTLSVIHNYMKVLFSIKDGDRFHEDIFGVTLRSSELTDTARGQAKKTWNSIKTASSPANEKEIVATTPSYVNKINSLLNGRMYNDISTSLWLYDRF